MSIHVTVWGEFRHEKKKPKVAALYPDGMHETIAAFLRRDAGLAVTTAWLDQPEHGLTVDRLEKTDVLLWWGHMAHGEVANEVVERVHRRVLEGMGLVVLHSGHYSKIFKRLMGTTCSLRFNRLMSSAAPASRCPKKVYAVPLRSARPVRPMRWT